MSKAGFARSKVIGAIICKLSEIRYLRYYPNVEKERLVKCVSELPKRFASSIIC